LFRIVRGVAARVLFSCLMMVAIGCAQLLGVGRGFWCLCTPEAKIVMVSECEPSVCHEGEACGREVGESTVVAGADGTHCHDGDESCSDTEGSGSDHRHREVRETLQSVAAGLILSMPQPPVSDLPPSVLVAPLASCGGLVWARGIWRSPAPDGSPPAPLLVARTMVRLV
jgi:hypothetical protein